VRREWEHATTPGPATWRVDADHHEEDIPLRRAEPHRRPVAHQGPPSLVVWAKSTAGKLAKVKARKIPPPGRLAWIGAESLLGWQAGVRLDQSAVPAAELGALYRSEIAALAAQPAGIVLHYASGRSHLAVKLGADRWLVCFGVDLESALAKSGYYCTDEALWMNLSSYFRSATIPSLQRGVEV
jgi:hypothetical protein